VKGSKIPVVNVERSGAKLRNQYGGVRRECILRRRERLSLFLYLLKTKYSLSLLHYILLWDVMMGLGEDAIQRTELGR